MNDADPKNLIINYIPSPVTDEELRQIFQQYGPVVQARVILDRATAQPKGYGFVKFLHQADANRAMKEMNGFEIMGKRLKITPARGPGHASTPSPPPYGTQSPQPVVVMHQLPPFVVQQSYGSFGSNVSPPGSSTQLLSPLESTAIVVSPPPSAAGVPSPPPSGMNATYVLTAMAR